MCGAQNKFLVGVSLKGALMATPKQLVSKIAEVTGVPEGTVILHDRNLMVAGLRSLGVRGRGTSAVTFGDAANLLIAVAASRNVKDSAKVVSSYKDLPADYPIDFTDEQRGASFGDAIAALMEVLAASPEAWKAGSDEDGFVDVFLYGPNPSAKIEIRANGKDHRYRYEPRFGRERPRSAGDLQFISKFSQSSLGHIGTLVAEK